MRCGWVVADPGLASTGRPKSMMTPAAVARSALGVSPQMSSSVGVWRGGLWSPLSRAEYRKPKIVPGSTVLRSSPLWMRFQVSPTRTWAAQECRNGRASLWSGCGMLGVRLVTVLLLSICLWSCGPLSGALAACGVAWACGEPGSASAGASRPTLRMAGMAIHRRICMS